MLYPSLFGFKRIGSNMHLHLSYGAIIFISYAWGKKDRKTGKYPNQQRALALHDELEKLGHDVIIDKYDFYGCARFQTLPHFMTKYIKSCEIFIPLLTSQYNKSKNCLKEFHYATYKEKDFVPVKDDPNYEFADEILFDIGTKKYLSAYDKSMEEVAAEIDKEITATISPSQPSQSDPAKDTNEQVRIDQDNTETKAENKKDTTMTMNEYLTYLLNTK